MEYRKNYGSEIDEKAEICPKCGVSQESNLTPVYNGGIGWGLGCVFL